MVNSVIRKIKLNDFKTFRQLLSQEWDLGKTASNASGNICAWIYLFSILSEADKIFCYEHNQKVIGFAGYQSHNMKANFRSCFYHLIFRLLTYSPQIKKREAIEKYYKTYEYIPSKFQTNKYCDLAILITDKNFRNQKIGSILFEYICQTTLKEGFSYLTISTDESCSYSFYTYKNCKKIKEVKIKDGEPNSVKGFVYIKKLISV